MTEPAKTARLKTLGATAMNNVADYDRSYYHVTVPNDVTLEDLLRPAFWTNHAPKLKSGALIDVVRENLTLDVQLRCIGTGIGYATMRVLRKWEDKEVKAALKQEDTGPVETKLPAEYKITSGRGSFSVTYVPSDAKIAQNCKTRAEAVDKAKEHAKQAGIAWPEATPEPAAEPA